MNLIRFGVVAAATLAVAAVVIPVTRAYTVSGYKWGTMSVPFYVNPANKDVSQNAAISALQAGLNAWSTQAGTPFRYVYAGQVSNTTTGNDRKNIILFRNVDNGGTIASTYWWYSNGVLIDSDIIFWDGGWTFFTGQSGCNNGAYIEDIATHELGHSLGLKHSNVSDATMYSSYSRCSQSLRTLSSDDIAGARKLYGTSSVTDTAPTVTILTPVNGASLTAGSASTFSGSATDTPDGDISHKLVWKSNLDGQIGSGATFSKALTAGSHTITATATDSAGQSKSSSVSVSVTQSTSTSTSTSRILTATARTSSTGARSTLLKWSGLTTARVDLHRNGAKIGTKENDGTAGDPVPGPGSYTYKMCDTDTSTCTNLAKVTY